MSQTDAPSWLLGHVLGREFRPFAFVISLATVRVTISLLSSTVTGSTLKGPLGVAFGLLALASVLLLWAGWWGKKDRWMTDSDRWGASGRVLTVAGFVVLMATLAVVNIGDSGVLT